MRFGICSEIFKEWNIEKVFPFVREAGYEGLEVAPFTIADSVEQISREERSRIKKLAGDSGVRIIGTHWLLAKPEGLSVSSKNRTLREKTADYLSALVNFTADIGGDIMVFGSPKQRNIGEGQTYEEVKGNVKEVLLKVLPECEKRNVSLCIEPLARTETNFMNTAAQAAELIEEINNPYLKLHLDVKAMSDESKSIPEIIRESSKHL
ncbi:MAG: sugar phosphate isomerase/epimerase, partial [Candidatus Omnitrophica bacterium]|nr:sugar phosphate isomerase/epimerase [Candidatus Omnitrophota bacterium]